MKRLFLIAVVLASGCGDKTSSAGQYVGFVTQDNYLLLLSATDFTQRLVQLEFGSGGGRLTARGSVFLASIGGSGRLDVVDIADNPDSVRRIGLNGMNPLDAAIADDSIAWVITPGYLIRVNYRARVPEGDVFLGIAGAGAPMAVAVTAHRVFVVEFRGTSSPGLLAVVDPVTMAIIDTATLTPVQPRLAVVGDDSLLYVVSSRAFTDSGKVSVVDPMTLRELAVITGMGFAPIEAQFHPTGSRLLVAAFGGIQEVNTVTKTLTRPPTDAVRPHGHAVEGIAVDQLGFIYAADSACAVDVLLPPPAYRVRRVVNAPPGLHCPVYGAVATKP